MALADGHQEKCTSKLAKVMQNCAIEWPKNKQRKLNKIGRVLHAVPHKWNNNNNCNCPFWKPSRYVVGRYQGT